MVYLAVFGGIAVFTLLLTVVAVRVRRAGDAESLALRAAQVLAECKELLVGQDVLWAVWQDTAKAASMTILVRDVRDAVVSKVTVVAMPLNGVLRRFELDGKQYEIYKPGAMSSRTCLREAGTSTVLLSAVHRTFRTTYFRGDDEAELFVAPMGSVFSRYIPLQLGNDELGRLIVGIKNNSLVRVLTVRERSLSRLEQVFLLANT